MSLGSASRRAGMTIAVVLVAGVLAACSTTNAGPTASPGGATGSDPATIGTPDASMGSIASPSPSPDPVDLAQDEEDASVLTDHPRIDYRGSDDWQISFKPDATHSMEAHADAPSYLPGQTLRLAVSTSSPSYTVSIFRVAAEMQPMSRSDPRPGMRQADAVVDPATSMVRAPWTYTYSQPIPADWPSGLYFAKLSGEGLGAQSYVPFVVRSTSPSRFLFVSAFLNAQAYNTWGGSSLYTTRVGEPAPGVGRAFAVTFDRPFSREDGMGELFTYEVPFIAWLEANHYDVTYTTDYDLSVDPTSQSVPKAALFSGHAEYWAAPLRGWLDEHVLQRGDMGLGVFAADTGYWRVRFREDSSTGPRTVVLYKNAAYDPDIQRTCGADTGRWAEAFRSSPCGRPGPGNLPEQALYGVQYGDIVPGYHPYPLVASAPASLLAGTGLAPGDSLGDIVGGEVDRVFTEYPQVPGATILAQADGLTTQSGSTTTAQAVVASLPSGGRTFGSGTFWWPWGLDAQYAAAHGVPPGFGTLTANILAFLAGP